MSKIPFSISDRSLTFYVDGQPYSIDRSSLAWDELKALVQAVDPDIKRLIALTNPTQVVADAVAIAEADYLPKGTLSVTRNSISYNGDPIDGVLVDRILGMLSEGFDIMPMIKFMENLMQNPTDFARDELYLWMENSDLPITEDGHFLAYKRVNNNFTSVHDGRTDNTPGKIVSMPRQKVDKVRAHTCSTGLHFCSKSYLPSFSGAKIVLLKINPADVVSIPSDYSNAKGRAWKYEVLHEVDFDIPTKTWGAVYVTDADDEVDDEDEYEATRDQITALFAAIKEIGISTAKKNRYDRLMWAEDALGDMDLLYRDNGNVIDSFSDLTPTQAGALIEYAREIKAEQDAESEFEVDAAVEEALDASQTAEAIRVQAINSYGIETLRRKASQAGLKNAYTGFKVVDLRKYLIDNNVV